LLTFRRKLIEFFHEAFQLAEVPAFQHLVAVFSVLRNDGVAGSSATKAARVRSMNQDYAVGLAVAFSMSYWYSSRTCSAASCEVISSVPNRNSVLAGSMIPETDGRPPS
jgi:hypothetical protein